MKNTPAVVIVILSFQSCPGIGAKRPPPAFSQSRCEVADLHESILEPMGWHCFC